ncbi:hypothetical protein DPMN_105092 [Dreissena polymorpha]|uniref:Uncharacterized protein n=1 Tax=Dreissena polymorpha TaxID=45954 RepID=A0A9D4HE74_DREPO|nr:hypothetical protein DPMN_105092 [Dreissena polymorpha]
MTGRSPVWSGHDMTGQVIGDRSGHLHRSGPVQSGPVTGQQSEEAGFDTKARPTDIV